MKPHALQTETRHDDARHDQEMFVRTHSLLNEISLGDKASPERIETILELLQHCLFLNMGRVLLLDKQQQELEIHYSYALPEDKCHTRYQLNEGISAQVFKSGSAITVFDVMNDSSYVGKITDKYNLPYHQPAFTAVPIKTSDNQVIGVLAVNHSKRDFSETAEVIDVLNHAARLISEIISQEKS